MIDAILIANRGEIARRVLRTCREMGIFALAVYSDADRDSLVVREADRAVRLGPAPAAESYLRGEALLAIAEANGVGAIHPGYGFLSENADFSAACASRGVTFIGPPPEVIRAMGDKAEAKRVMAAAGVPIVPGYQSEAQDAATLAREAEGVGFPLMIKAVAGGGGRGIRIVRGAGEMDAAVESARREAASGFRDDRLMLERYLPAPRHVEFQIMADHHGTVLHLCERECSVQRRHQKVIEEAPSPALSPEQREAMAEAAVRAGRAVGYLGAGTVEFLVDGEGGFYFLEMNTRLQVEHPVTEMTLGLDLVRMQIEVAEGRPLAVAQGEVAARGHAIECRLNAEVPASGFLPSIGALRDFDFPEGPGLRVDTGFAAGAVIGPHYDSLLAKLVAWGANREEALRKMAALLSGAMITGLETNLALLQAVVDQEAFRAGDYDTGILEDHLTSLLNPPLPAGLEREQLLAAAAVEVVLQAESAAQDPEVAPGEGNGAHASPWGRKGRWAASVAPDGTFRREAVLHGRRHPITVEVLAVDGGAVRFRVLLEDTWHEAGYQPTGPRRGLLDVGDARVPVRWDARGERRWLSVRGQLVAARVEPLSHAAAGGAAAELGAHLLLAPLPGKVVKWAVSEGQEVAEKDLLVIVEAMKMEHRIEAPYAGTVARLHFREGDPVERDDLLLDLEAAAPD